MRGINGDLDLERTLDAVARGVVDGLGFEVAVVNLVMPDGDLEVVAVAGSDEARDTLMGGRGSREEWDRWLRECTPAGDVLVDYRRQSHDDAAVPTWVPDRPVSADEDAWHPLDALIAPLTTSRSGLVGTISVDLPRDGRRPGAEQLQLLEMYAAQASVAIENASLHTALVTRDADRERIVGRLTALVTEAPVAILELDLQGQVRLWNPAAEEMFGWTADEVLGRLNPTVDAEGYAERMAELSRGEVVHRAITRRARKDGTDVEVEMSSAVLRHPDGTAFGYIGAMVDVTERALLEQELRTAAYTDPLTGLANRGALRERLESDARVPAALLLLDLDGFKGVNDTLGHAAGDAVLQQVGQRIRRSCRPNDLVVRLGGDEFVVLVADGEDRVEPLAKRLLRVLSDPFSLGEREVTLGCSIGIAHPRATGPDTALRDADIAMYAAKAGGKGRFQVFEPPMRVAVLERAELAEDLRTALADDELSLRYHPVVDVPTQRVVGLEALLRWNHPTRGELSPLLFVPLAEESGLINDIGEWVMREACTQLRRWHADHPEHRRLTVSVNLSAVQLHVPDLVERVAQVLSDTGLPPRRLVLELTESVLVDDDRDTVSVLQRLRDLGIRLAMDDFGAGFSSLRYLKRLPFDFVKLDRGLLEGVDRDPAALALADAVLGLLSRLGLRTVAEGIETRGQLAVVEGLGCQYGQGFLFGRPLLPQDVPALLAGDGGRIVVPSPRAATAGVELV
ncbi:MAG: EAL domain-containing protein [Actinobacteria bacterium]|nr:EAL domain-containing protein [Actinomycetota bacterium]